jgi:hypothetical protein
MSSTQGELNEPEIEQVSRTVKEPVKLAATAPGLLGVATVPLRSPLPRGPAVFTIVKVPLSVPSTATEPVTAVCDIGFRREHRATALGARGEVCKDPIAAKATLTHELVLVLAQILFVHEPHTAA